jgi:hypothetical protein
MPALVNIRALNGVVSGMYPIQEPCYRFYHRGLKRRSGISNVDLCAGKTICIWNT